MTQNQLATQVVIVDLTRYVSMVSVLPYRHAAVDVPPDQRVLMEYVFRIIHVAEAVPTGKRASTEYVRRMILAQAVAQMKLVLTEHVNQMILVQTVPLVKFVLTEPANLIPVLIVKMMKYVSMEIANRSEVMRTSDKLNLSKC